MNKPVQAVKLAEPCRIIGVLDDGAASLNVIALGHIQQADLVIGGPRTLKLFSEYFLPGAEVRNLTGQLMQVTDWVRDAMSAERKVVVLATGDPLCHGIAGFLQSRLCIEACEVFPNLSMVQLACARIGMPWQDISICSVHSKDLGEWLPDVAHRQGLYPLLAHIQKHEKLAIYTSPDNTPGRVARMLVVTGLADRYQIAVAERLLQPDERVLSQCSVEDVAKLTFADPNIVLLWRSQPNSTAVRFGLPDAEFYQRKPEKGLITKCEIRAVSLARMQLRTDSVVWDIGAGSGAVGIEAALLCPDGCVMAIEKNAADVENAIKNKLQFSLQNYLIVHAKAPTGLQDWPEPDAIFIGGSGGKLAELIELCLDRLSVQGRLIMNFVTFENVSLAIRCLKKAEVQWDITQLQTSRSKPILDMHRLEAENPVWIISASPATERSE